jgi:hypothetical protein
MKTVPVEYIGVEVGAETLTAVALSAKSDILGVYHTSLSAPESWAQVSAEWLPSILNRAPKALAFALNFKSQQILSLRLSFKNTEQQAFLNWAQSLYAGETHDAFVADTSVTENKALSQINAHHVALRKQEIHELSHQLESTWMRPTHLEGALESVVAAALASSQGLDGIVFRLDRSRAQWAIVQGQQLKTWGDFSISMDGAESNHWLKRIREILLEQNAQANQPCWVAGPLLHDTDVVSGLAGLEGDIRFVEPFKPLKGQASHTAAYAGAWWVARCLKGEQ